MADNDEDGLTDAELRWVRESYRRTVDCRTWGRDLVFGLVRWLLMGSFAALGWLLLSGAREWIRITLVP